MTLETKHITNRIAFGPPVEISEPTTVRPGEKKVVHAVVPEFHLLNSLKGDIRVTMRKRYTQSGIRVDPTGDHPTIGEAIMNARDNNDETVLVELTNYGRRPRRIVDGFLTLFSTTGNKSIAGINLHGLVDDGKIEIKDKKGAKYGRNWGYWSDEGVEASGLYFRLDPSKRLWRPSFSANGQTPKVETGFVTSRTVAEVFFDPDLIAVIDRRKTPNESQINTKVYHYDDQFMQRLSSEQLEKPGKTLPEIIFVSMAWWANTPQS